MIELYKPKIEDLWFKEQLLSCEETMAYNKRYGGCISFSSDKWDSWYNRWMTDPTKFYQLSHLSLEKLMQPPYLLL